MDLKNKVVFVSGANRGIGKALVEALVKAGVKKVYAGVRKITDIPNFGDPKVVIVKLDITNENDIKAATKQAKDTQILFNNAGTLAYASVLEGPMELIKRDMDVNYYGTLNLTRAFVPILQSNGDGAIASISSIVGLASMAGVGGYCASKAALFSAIQSMRVELKSKNIKVYGIFPGPIDTDMASSIEMSKTSPAETAENILKAIIEDNETIFPDPLSSQWGNIWRRDPLALQSQFSEF